MGAKGESMQIHSQYERALADVQGQLADLKPGETLTVYRADSEKDEAFQFRSTHHPKTRTH